jgi:hypothetical protein
MLTTPRLVVRHSFGRRYGTRAFLVHQRNYARGRGAWVGKLQMWGHRLGAEWSRTPELATQLRALVRRPDRWLLDAYANREARAARAEYESMYEIGDDLLCHPRESGLHC